MSDSTSTADAGAVRIDRWLWAARFYKTRSLAKAAIEGGKIHLEGQRVKPAKEIRIGQTLHISRGQTEQVVLVTGLSERRGSATIAATLYTETDESIEERQRRSAQRRMQNAGLVVPANKPSKKDRRELRKLKLGQNDDD